MDLYGVGHEDVPVIGGSAQPELLGESQSRKSHGSGTASHPETDGPGGTGSRQGIETVPVTSNLAGGTGNPHVGVLARLSKRQYKDIPEAEREYPLPRAKTKTQVAIIKLTAECQQAWEAAGAAEKRSLANMFEIAIWEYCKRHRIAEEGPGPAVNHLAGLRNPLGFGSVRAQ